MSITTMTFAARDFSARRGASDEHTLQGSVRSEQRSLAEKQLPPEGLRRIWPVARCSSVTDPLRDMLPPRAWPQAKFGATYVIVVMFMTTKLQRSSKSQTPNLKADARANGAQAVFALGAW